MSDVTLSYKGSDILELSDSGSATLKTGGTYCEADIEVEYVKPSGGGGAENLFEVIDVIYDNKATSNTYASIPISDGTKDNYLVTWAIIEHGNYTDGVLVMDTDISIATSQNIPIFGSALYKKNVSNFSTFSGSFSSITETNSFMYGAIAVVRTSRSTYANSASGTGLTLEENNDGFRLSSIPLQYAPGKVGQYFKYRFKVHGWNNGTPNATPVVVNVT